MGSEEVLQVQLQRLQSGQLLGEVDGLNRRMIRVPVQLFLQRSVDLIQRAQQELETYIYIVKVSAQNINTVAVLQMSSGIVNPPNIYIYIVIIYSASSFSKSVAWKSRNSVVTNIIQNIFFCDQQKELKK